MFRLPTLGLASAVILAACASAPPATETPVAMSAAAWTGAWAAAPAPPAPDSRTFENQTVRQTIRLGSSGDQVRLKLTNAYGKTPLKVGAATFSINGGAAVPVLFNGKPATTVPAGAPLLSDPVDMKVAAKSDLVINLYFPESTGPCSCHPLAMKTSQVSSPGDFTASGFEAADTFTNRAFISGVEVLATDTRVIVAFGDSITDGYGGSNDTNNRWPDILLNRLDPTANVGVVNAAISGNRILSYGLAMFGEPALTRLDRDVLAISNAEWIVMLEGVNDIGMGRGKGPSTDEMIAGYKQVIARAHVQNIKVIGATILPFEGAAYYTEPAEAVRQEINTWMRTSGAFDGVIDFDAVMRDPENPKRMKEALQVGDWLHPNDAGYNVMGNAIDLSLFE